VTELERNEMATMYRTIEVMYYEISRLDARTKIGEDVMVENEALRTQRYN